MSLNPKRVLFLDSVHPVLEQELTAMGFVCIHEYQANRTEVSNYISDYQGIVLRSRLIIDAEILKNANQLEFILRSGSGMENIDVEYAKSKNIACFNSPEGNADAVGEHTIGLMLSLLNKITIANLQVKNGIWKREENRGLELKSRCVGLLGYGHMGKAVAKRLQSFGCDTLFMDPLQETDAHAKKAQEKEFFEKVEILSLHTNYLASNFHLVDHAFIQRMKNSFILINTARGKIVNTEALIKALDSGKIIAAGLDVNEFENHHFQHDAGTFHPLLQKLSEYPQVIITPHVAGWTTESYFKLSAVLAEKVKSLYQKK